MTRIFRVELEHLTYGRNWTSRDVAARTAAEAIRKAERGEGTRVRATDVSLIAEMD